MESTLLLQAVSTMGLGGFLLRLLIVAAICLVATKFLKGIYLKNFSTAVVLALVLSLLNATVGWILSMVAVPINFLSFGLFSGLIALFINAIVIKIADNLLKGFKVDNIWWALGLALILSLGTGLFNLQFGVSM